MEIPKIVTKVGLGLASGLLVAPVVGTASAYANTVADDGPESIVAGAYKKMAGPEIAAGAYKKSVTADTVVLAYKKRPSADPTV